MSQRINYESPHANRYCGRSRTQKSLRTCVFCSCLGTLCRVCTRILAQDQPWGRDELTESGGRLLLSVVGVCCLVCHGACISMLMGFGPGVCLCVVWYGFTISRTRGRREEGRKEGKKEEKEARNSQSGSRLVYYAWHICSISLKSQELPSSTQSHQPRVRQRQSAMSSRRATAGVFQIHP